MPWIRTNTIKSDFYQTFLKLPEVFRFAKRLEFWVSVWIFSRVLVSVWILSRVSLSVYWWNTIILISFPVLPKVLLDLADVHRPNRNNIHPCSHWWIKVRRFFFKYQLSSARDTCSPPATPKWLHKMADGVWKKCLLSQNKFFDQSFLSIRKGSDERWRVTTWRLPYSGCSAFSDQVDITNRE